MGSGCCDPRSSLNACPDDNFSLVCTIEIDGCKKVYSLTGETKDYHKQKRTAIEDPLVLDACIADFEGGIAQFLILMTSAPVIVTLSTPASDALPTSVCDAVAQAEVGTGPYVLASIPVIPSSVSITYSDSAPAAVTMTDNGAGVLAGSNGDSGTIDYVTGDVVITFTNGLTTAVTFNHQFTHSDATFDIPVTSMLHLNSDLTGITITPVSGTADVDLCVGRFTL